MRVTVIYRRCNCLHHHDWICKNKRFLAVYFMVFFNLLFDDVWDERNKEGPTLTFLIAVREIALIKLDRIVTTQVCNPVDEISSFCAEWSKFW